MSTDRAALLAVATTLDDVVNRVTEVADRYRDDETTAVTNDLDEVERDLRRAVRRLARAVKRL